MSFISIHILLALAKRSSRMILLGEEQNTPRRFFSSPANSILFQWNQQYYTPRLVYIHEYLCVDGKHFHGIIFKLMAKFRVLDQYPENDPLPRTINSHNFSM